MRIKTDVLVIGSGIAGLRFAIEISKFAEVYIVTKKDKAESNTNYAQGGIAT
ncbi:MAG: FAD-binding protein, partial [Ignavibacteria bacterium]